MTLLQHISTAENQKFNGSLLKPEFRDELVTNITKILTNRDCERDIGNWEEYIHSIPDCPDFVMGMRYSNVFEQLVSSFGGDVQVINIILNS